MTQWHLKSKRKKTGGFRNAVNSRDKKLSQRGGEFSATNIAADAKEVKRKTVRGRGGKHKVKLQSEHFANVTDLKTNKTSKAKIITVKENIANREYVRRNVITKNAIIEIATGAGNKLAKVTSRPGQSGNVSAVLIEKIEKAKAA
ncbi:MAG: 30S ribosomal protein S8e [Candidatus Diapherotrites archaeon]|nr:30S ribosomal protein S8e [Candidatus Diapherotrites archaeon]